jgi:hypothetical protein
LQAAEKNIADRFTKLNAQYRQQRQNSITGELLDIVAGFEAPSTNLANGSLASMRISRFDDADGQSIEMFRRVRDEIKERVAGSIDYVERLNHLRFWREKQ